MVNSLPKPKNPSKPRCPLCKSSDFVERSKGKDQPKRLVCRVCDNRKRKLRTAGLKKVDKVPTKSPAVKSDQTIVVTYAQNATPVNKRFWASLQTYCKHNNARLVVVPGRYVNPTSTFADAKHDWWASEILPHLVDGIVEVGKFRVFGDISIQPTATRPLTGFEVFSGAYSAVFGHPKIQLSTVATATRQARILTTTGACTRANYTKSKAGRKGEAHHVFGAVVIEKGKHCRHINAVKDGSFIDLDKLYDGESVSAAPPALALVCGDIHVDMVDPGVVKATFDAPDSIVKTLRPEKIVLHDLIDFRRRNHHQINDLQDRYARRQQGKQAEDVRSEILEAIDFVDTKCPGAIIVQSNHDEAFDRWLSETDIKRDPLNAKFYHEMWVAKLAAYDEEKCWTSALELCYRRHGKSNARFIKRNEEYSIAGIVLNLHGDKGLNGSRGSASAYASLGVKTILGHHHAPYALDGAYCVGTSSLLDMGYNTGGPSSWMHCHVLVNAHGKRTHLFVDNGEWR